MTETTEARPPTERPAVAPAPRVPAPLKAAPPPRGFDPVAGMVVPKSKRSRFGRRRERKPKTQSVFDEKDAVESVEDEEEDLIPTWVYRFILSVCTLGFFVAFLFWNSSSPIIGPGWKFSFLIEMVMFAIVGLVMLVRLGRKQHYGRRTAAFMGRRRDGFVRGVKGVGHGMVGAAKGVRSGGANMGEGLRAAQRSNFVVRGFRAVFRFIGKVFFFLVRFVIGFFRLFYSTYVLVVRIGWLLYRGIVEPVLRMAFALARWALRIVWRVGRWALNVVWTVFYWVVRRWPFKYVTRALQEPVQFHVQPRVLTTNVVVSDFLGAPVKPQVRTAAAPFVELHQLKRESHRAARAVERHEIRDAERSLWLTIPTKDEKKMREMERIRLRAEEKARHEQSKIDEKEAKKHAKKDRKEHDKEQKEKRKEGKTEAEAPAPAVGELAAASNEAPTAPEASAPAAEEAPKKLSRAEKKAQKKQDKLLAIQAKAREKEEERRAKAEAKAAKKAEKAAKREKGKDESGEVASVEAPADAPPIAGDETGSRSGP